MAIEKTIVVGPFQCNCRLLVCEKTGEAALIDPGDEAARIIGAVRGIKLTGDVPLRVTHLLHTHAHLDHIGATRDVKQSLGSKAGAAAAAATPKICLHRDDEELYRALKTQGQLFGMSYEDPLPVEKYLEHEEEIAIGELKLSVIHVPGHSPGSISLRLHESSGSAASAGVRETVFTGDTLFQGSVGRTDLWGADGDQMFRSIRERLLTLDGDTRVCPGHGPDSRIGVEKRENPFLR